jgi:hypothetical protein
MGSAAVVQYVPMSRYHYPKPSLHTRRFFLMAIIAMSRHRGVGLFCLLMHIALDGGGGDRIVRSVACSVYSAGERLYRSGSTS